MDNRRFIARRAAQYFNEGDTVNLGIGIPSACSDYVDPTIAFQTENGMIGVGPVAKKLAICDTYQNAGGINFVPVMGASAFDTAYSFAVIRSGRMAATVLGALQVAENGDIANWASPGRAFGMGGAMGALGGDISTMSTNPAGIGLFRSSDVMTSFGFSAYGTESKYLDNKLNSDKSRASFDNIGFVFSSKIGNNTPLRFVNFGFNYHKAKSFYKNMNMKGNLGDYSQTFLMASQAGGIEGWGDNPYDDPNIGWLSVLGYDGWVITDITTDKINPATGKPNNIYTDKDGNQINNFEGKPLYVSPGNYKGMFPYGNANFRSEERGGIDQYDFNVSFNINDRVYLGLTLGAYSVDSVSYTHLTLPTT